jgi:excinuclease ABC subunit A
VLVIEHNLDVIKTADWIIDMGPEGGSRGGMVVAEGTPEEIAASPDSFTGEFLAPLLEGTSSRVAAPPRKRTAAAKAPATKKSATGSTKKSAAGSTRKAATAKKTPTKTTSKTTSRTAKQTAKRTTRRSA